MFTQVEKIQNRMSPEALDQLSRIFAPREVAVPVQDPMEGLCVTPDGEIRFYGEGKFANRQADGKRVYLSSGDGGLNWSFHEVDSDLRLGRCLYAEGCDLYIKFVSVEDTETDRHIPALQQYAKGTFALLSNGGPDSTEYSVYKVNDNHMHIFRQLLYFPEIHRLLTVSQFDDMDGDTSAVLYSDDFGKTWTTLALPRLPKREITPPDKWIRWQNYSCEPTVVQLDGAKLQIVFRTSYNFHYQYVSEDYGETWSKPFPTDFHGTLTMPLLKRLSNGNLLFLWCNTQPLPELSPEEYPLPLSNWEKEGIHEIVFTNRDANHAALSDDNGKTWHGFREMALNPIRNHADFRSAGQKQEGLDKSVHQFECVELPLGKVLVAYGQNSACRRIIIFDPAWLLENERREDFLTGTTNVSTHTYLTSVPGVIRGYHAHCSWNRTDGPVLMPDPDGNYREALYLTRVNDPRLFSQAQGVVWNFPATHSGTVTFMAHLSAAGLTVCLTDHWYNPIDTEVMSEAQISFVLDETCAETGTWIPITVFFQPGNYSVTVNTKPIIRSSIISASVYGLSYLHIQSREPIPGTGSYVRDFYAFNR